MTFASTERIVIVDEKTSPVDGAIRWAPAKSLWLFAMTAVALVAGPLTLTWSAFGLFIVTSGITLCFGHSVGMHRKLIHGSFDCPLWLERTFVYLGTLVGMAGPIGMIRLHDHRDWAQRQPACHRYSRHDAGFWRDGWWQLHCRLDLKHPPKFQLEPRLANDRFYGVVERTWMWQQLPWAILFYAVGGWPWVVWGICVRVAVCEGGPTLNAELLEAGLIDEVCITFSPFLGGDPLGLFERGSAALQSVRVAHVLTVDGTVFVRALLDPMGR